jgi:hypothetical protein
MAKKKREPDTCVCGHKSLDHWADWDGIHSCEIPGCSCTGYRFDRSRLPASECEKGGPR